MRRPDGGAWGVTGYGDDTRSGHVSLRVSVLDQSPIADGSTGGEALQRTIDLARRAEALGYHRYWVAEHHGTPMLAGAAPEILIGAIAAATTRLRVGSGGVMLPHYSPLKVAEVFSLLSALHPGRIDLGLGRAAGTDPLTTFALQRDRRQAAPDDFPQQLAELLAYLYDRFPAGHRFARLAALPGGAHRPEPWLLGSSPQSGLWAAEIGLPYAFADFINPEGADYARRYRDTFVPSGVRAAPEVIVCVSAICAETDDEAERLAASGRMAFALLHQGELIPVPPVEKALRFLAARESCEGPRAPRRRRAVIGSPATVRRGLEAVAAEYGADELMIVTITYDHEARCRSYALIAEAFGRAPAR
ncbi:MAG: LLM class flavin-dependent oxidoreductase [Acidobacteriota bacterium]|nr:LLM class flavin-dependent oxidoreductase [Acidobacteriota bacterium]